MSIESKLEAPVTTLTLTIKAELPAWADLERALEKSYAILAVGIHDEIKKQLVKAKYTII